VSALAEDERPEPEATETEAAETAPEAPEPESPEPESPEPESPEPESPEPEPDAARPQEATVEELMAAMREIKIAAFLLQTTSTLASLAYGKLEAGELEETRTAIDAIGALVPVLEGRVDDPVHKDFERALANLRLAYASAASKAEPSA
jgi:hypothetical protein